MTEQPLSRRDWIRQSGAYGLALAGSVRCAVNAQAGGEPDSIKVGSRRELFVDNHLIEQIDGARRQLHHPAPREVALTHDQPWEGNTCFYHTVFQDGDVYRMYYRGSQHNPQQGATHQVVCYAESEDGIHWRKPELALVDFKGSKQNNIIWDGTGDHNFVPFKDQNPDCEPAARYKAIGGGNGGLVVFQSPDAIHWSLIREKPVITNGAFDSQNLAFWDTVRGCYVDYHRKGRAGKRDIMTCTSPDFLNWMEPKFLQYPDAPAEHLYVNQIQQYHRAPHIYLGFPKRFVPNRPSPVGHPLPGVSDTVLMSSRDGETFHRWQEAFIRPGPQPDRWVCRNNLAAWGLVETSSPLPGAPDELSLYVVEGYYQGKSCRLRRHTLRMDGFVSVHGPFRGGYLLTKPLSFTGRQLRINFATSAAGSLRVELQDQAGTPIPGYALTDCDVQFGDELDRSVSWNGKTDLSHLVNQPIRLRVQLNDADLFSLRFPDEDGAGG